jgi:2-dehydro-3-deoxyphosphogluconate aldolase / (4S)-4-hydroxy-2-oxoglutarate aldolase
MAMAALQVFRLMKKSNMLALSKILKHKIIAIVRGAAAAETFKIARALADGGIRVLEITLNSPNAFAAIEEVSDRMGKELLVGAGTVMDARSAKKAIAAGASFILSPTLDKGTIRATKKHGAVSLPGAFTATEILAAYHYGGDIIKVFPASSVGAKYFKELRGPMPYIPLMPSGGIHAGNMGEYLEAGVVAFGIGGALIDTTREMTPDYLQEVTEKARKLVEALGRQPSQS